MERLKKGCRKLFFPGKATMLLLTPASALLLAWVFAFGHEDHALPISPTFYLHTRWLCCAWQGTGKAKKALPP